MKVHKPLFTHPKHYESLPVPQEFSTVEETRLHRKQRLAAAFRIFAKLGYDEGGAGHITVRDPEFPDTFWVNSFGIDFSQINVSNLIRVDHKGNVVEGARPVNRAAFVIHASIHAARPDVLAIAHAHTIYGKVFSSLGISIDPINLDACAFYNDHAIYNDFGGVVIELDEGVRLVNALGSKKALIMQNHGHLVVGATVDAAAWWFINMERSFQAQLLVMSSGKKPFHIKHESALQTYSITGTAIGGWFQFQPMYDRILKEQPDFLE